MIVINLTDIAHIDVSSSVMGYIIDFVLMLAIIPQGGQRSGSTTETTDCDAAHDV